LRATREIALELAFATAADPVAAGRFKDAAGACLQAPPIPPHASLDAISRSNRLIFVHVEYEWSVALIDYLVPAIVILVCLLPGKARRAFLGDRRANVV
jgi:hypothetical protein